MTTFSNYLKEVAELKEHITEDANTVHHIDYEGASKHHTDQELHHVAQGFNKTHSRSIKSSGGGNSYHGKKSIYRHPDGRQITVKTKSVLNHKTRIATHSSNTYNK